MRLQPPVRPARDRRPPAPRPERAARPPRPTRHRVVPRPPSPDPGPGPVWNDRFPHLPTVLARAVAPARRPGPPQLRVFHLAYAVVTLPAILALHVALWVLATPARLLVTALVVFALSHSGAVVPVP